LVAKDVRRFRTPEGQVPPELWPYRSTWVSKNGKWVQLEDRVCWSNLADPKAKIEGCVDKGIFRFESEFKATPAEGGATGACPGSDQGVSGELPRETSVEVESADNPRDARSTGACSAETPVTEVSESDLRGLIVSDLTELEISQLLLACSTVDRGSKKCPQKQ
jgi:hypothetical protein